VEEQLLQIKFDWPVRLAHPMEVITPWPHMPNLIQLVQGTEHGSVSRLITPSNQVRLASSNAYWNTSFMKPLIREAIEMWVIRKALDVGHS
jgi:hypothetical protein